MGPAEPRFDRTISRVLVHKAGAEAVWVTDLIQLGESRFLGAAHFPRANSFVNDQDDPRYSLQDLAFLVELGRQVGIGTMHAHLGAPAGWSTVFLKLQVSVPDPVPAPAMEIPVPVTVGLEIPNREVDEDGALRSVTGELEIETNGTVLARAAMLVGAMPHEEHDRMREDSRGRKPLDAAAPDDPAPLPPERVGRRDSRNVLPASLAAGGDGSYVSRIRVDRTHPYFFEHPIDHIPGVLLVEAFRQTSVAAVEDANGLPPAGALVSEVNVRFTEFAEPELPLGVQATVQQPAERPGGGLAVPVRVAAEQPGCPSPAAGRLVLLYPDGR